MEDKESNSQLVEKTLTTQPWWRRRKTISVALFIIGIICLISGIICLLNGFIYDGFTGEKRSVPCDAACEAKEKAEMEKTGVYRAAAPVFLLVFSLCVTYFIVAYRGKCARVGRAQASVTLTAEEEMWESNV